MNWRDSLKWRLAELGVKVRGVSFMFDLVNACSFRCPSCPVGNSLKRDGGVMRFDYFRRMLDRIQEQTRIRYVLLYSFSEPFLHPELPRFIAELKRRGVGRVMASTNLSRTKNLEASLAAGLDELRISFSGFDLGEYFHAGRHMRQFTEACENLSVIAPKYKTTIGLIFHVYKTNKHELPTVESFARRHGFNLIKETAFFIPFEKIVRKTYTPEDRQLIGHLIRTPEEKLAQQDHDELCYYQQKQIVVDANGKVFLCRHVFEDSFIVGDIMLDSIHEIRKRMRDHPFCLDCKGCGLNKYTEPT
jgi:MoaA/NifB/PqqE/SkfB family radical SAM enzyme